MILESIPFIIGLLAFIVLAVAALFIAHIRLSRKLKRFMLGKSASSLEESLESIIERNSTIEKTLSAHKEALEIINTRLSGSIRGTSLVRYDAFQNSGGAQSFAAGFLDEHGNGFILSVVTNRSHVGVYAKPVAGFVATVELTPEESEALMKTKEQQKI